MRDENSESGATGAANGDAGYPRGVVFVDALFTAMSRVPQARAAAAEFEHQWCHMWSDDPEALHALAEKIGMRREWFQDDPRLPHYDLLPPLRQKAIALGAVARDLAGYLRAKRNAEKLQSAITR